MNLIENYSDITIFTSKEESNLYEKINEVKFFLKDKGHSTKSINCDSLTHSFSLHWTSAEKYYSKELKWLAENYSLSFNSLSEKRYALLLLEVRKIWIENSCHLLLINFPEILMPSHFQERCIKDIVSIGQLGSDLSIYITTFSPIICQEWKKNVIEI